MTAGRTAAVTTRTRDRLDALADLTLLGLGVTVVALGVVTPFIGLIGAAQVLADREDERPVLRRFRAALRTNWRTGLRLQAMWWVVVIVATVDLLTASAVPVIVRPAVFGTGVVLMLGAAVLPPFLAVAVVAAPRTEQARAGSLLRTTVAVGVLAATGRPLRAGVVLALSISGLVAASAMAASVVLVGLLAVLALRCASPAVSTVLDARPQLD